MMFLNVLINSTDSDGVRKIIPITVPFMVKADDMVWKKNMSPFCEPLIVISIDTDKKDSTTPVVCSKVKWLLLQLLILFVKTA